MVQAWPFGARQNFMDTDIQTEYRLNHIESYIARKIYIKLKA